jgi:hypothetical protein
LAAQNPPSSICWFNQIFAALVHTKTSNNSVISLFNHLTQTKGISPDEYTYAVLMDYCAITNQVGRSIVWFSGTVSQSGRKTNILIFSLILSSLCWENRIDEAAVMVLDKIPETCTQCGLI